MACKNDTQFKNVDQQLQDLIVKILDNQTIAKLLYYPTKDALSKPDISDPVDTLKDTHIYLFRFRPPIETETVIMSVFFSSFNADPTNVYLKKATIEIGICVHRNIWSVDDGIRVNKIIGEIDDILNKQFLIQGLNKEFFKDSKYYDFSDVHSGYVLHYTGTMAQ